MRILCAYSSITFNCEHFPGFLDHGEAYHPIFNLPQKKLLSNIGKWASGSALTQTDNYLLFLALLRSSDLVTFRVPAVQTEQTPAIIANCMESLARTLSRINTITHPAAVFPQYVISPDTKDLSNVHWWIQNWNDSYKEFQAGYKSAHDSQKLIIRETALERLIKNPHRPVSSYSSQISDWAAVAGSFPTFTTKSPFTGLPISCSEFWKLIITKCAKEDHIFSIPQNDLKELLEHCEEHIPIGSIFSNALFKLLRHALERQKNYLGLGDLDLSSGSYRILNPNDSVEDANLDAMRQAAPETKPTPEQYPSKFLYLKAKLRWDMAQKSGVQS
jgi:hypothetical protein